MRLRSLLILLPLLFLSTFPLWAKESKTFDYGSDPMRYLKNQRVCLGIDLSLGGAITFLSDQKNGGANMINSVDWGRQIQLSYYSGPTPFIGPNGEKPVDHWKNLGWNPIQSGDYGGYRSQVLKFEKRGKNKFYVETIPMLWPHINVPAEATFETLYTLLPNGFILDARINTHRSDLTQYPAKRQEMPAVYTNGVWYKLVSYLGDKPFENEPLSVLVDRGDELGWPWLDFYAPEQWCALVDDNGMGLGVYQPASAQMKGGFFGGDENKGIGGEKDSPTGYIAPIAKMILDHNMVTTYRTIFIVGTVDEIRSEVYKRAKKLPKIPNWVFSDSRHYWIYDGSLVDQGYPIQGALKIHYDEAEQGGINSPVTFWKAEDAKYLEIDAAFSEPGNMGASHGISVHISPVAPADFIGHTSWPLTDPDPEKEKIKEEKRKKLAEEYPTRSDIWKNLDVQYDGQRRVYRIDMSEHPEYVGGMKKVGIVFSKITGDVEIYRIGFSNDDQDGNENGNPEEKGDDGEKE